LFNIKDSHELLKALVERKPWNQVRAEVLKALIDNAKSDVLKISRFVFVSEYYDCIKSNYVDLAAIWKDPRLALSAIGATLVGLSGDIIQHMGRMKEGSEQLAQATGLVEMSLHSAILCDPYLLSAYKALASFYYGIGKSKLAAAACRSFDNTEKKLQEASDDYLRGYRETKYKPAAAEMRAGVDQLKRDLGMSGP
ncbi:MAG TPA: hypothetical protein VMM82_03460, partial [Spirochaetia bacterium]|nr:hypothetical protein [Spirochaetia bacterium]